MEIILALLIACAIGLLVKVLLSFFDATRPWADAAGLVVAILVFLARLGYGI